MEKLFDTFMIGYQVEIKSERHIWEKTKNHFVEYSYLPYGKEDIPEKWEARGISATTSTYWALMLVNDKEECVGCDFVLTDELKALAKVYWNDDKRNIRGGDDNRSKGILVPIEEIAKLAYNR